MTQFKYPHFLLGTVVAGLWFAGDVYATQSPLTSGPSVGHRPVMTNLVLGTKVGPANGVITDSTAILSVGSTIGLLDASGGPGGVDVDGDEDKAGAYCVWYKVPASGGTPILIQDGGPTDRNCHYTIQMSDVGFKIKADVTIFSDTDKAQVKGYTINPIESIVTEALSATAVAAPYIKGLQTKSRTDMSAVVWTHNEKDGFPTVGYSGAEFKMLIDNGTGTLMNSQYTWQSSNTGEVSVDNDGNIIINKAPSGEISITATPSVGSALTYRFTIRDWFINYGANGSFTSIANWGNSLCVTSHGGTGLATQAQMTPAKKVGEYPSKPAMGSLFGEWGSTGPSLFSAGNFFFWLNSTTLVEMQAGAFSKTSNSNAAANGMCHIRL